MNRVPKHRYQLKKAKWFAAVLDRLFVEHRMEPGDADAIHGFVAEAMHNFSDDCATSCVPRGWHDRLEAIQSVADFRAYDQWLVDHDIDLFPEYAAIRRGEGPDVRILNRKHPP